MSVPTIHGVVPYVYCADAGEVADWCVRVLGLKEQGRWYSGDTVSNVELTAGSNEVWLDGGNPDWPQQMGDLRSWVGFWVEDVDAMYEYVRARTPSVKPPIDRDFGIRMLSVADPEGHEWSFMRRLQMATPVQDSRHPGGASP